MLVVKMFSNASKVQAEMGMIVLVRRVGMRKHAYLEVNAFYLYFRFSLSSSFAPQRPCVEALIFFFCTSTCGANQFGSPVNYLLIY